uniref:Reverse transcriptase RNase H-like domain-containing protein n=1 Tax=Chenopodium quinoa TaxID=63459 RepID=A0A803NAQ1_CHEQI
MMKLRELKHSSTIKEYIKQFTTLVLEIDNLPEAAQLIYFIGGLQRWAQQEVERRNVKTLAEAIAAAESLVDYRDTRKEGRSNGIKGKGGGAKPTDRSSTNSNKTVKKDKAKGSSSSSSSSDKPNNRGCYLCGGPHWARDCPGRQKLSAIIASGGESSGDDAQMGSLRLFSSVRATPKAEESTKVVQVSTLPRPKGSLMFVDTLVNGRASKALVDCGASHNFITEKKAMNLGIKYTKEPGRIKTVNTSPVPILGVAHKVPICLGQWSGTINLTVVHMDDFSLVLGLEFIDTVRPVSFKADGSIMIKRDQGSWSVPVTPEEVEAKTISAIQVSKGIKKGKETFLAALVEKEEPHGNEVPSEISGVLVEYKDEAFDDLKDAVTKEPVLALPDYSKPFELHTDASDFAIGGVLMQEGHPVAYESRKLNDTERRYPVHDKEMTAIIHCLRVWRHYLLGSRFTIYTNNVATSYFQNQKKLSPKQARWQDFLADFDYAM